MDWEIKPNSTGVTGVETQFLLAALLFDMSDWRRRPRHRLPLDHRRQA